MAVGHRDHPALSHALDKRTVKQLVVVELNRTAVDGAMPGKGEFQFVPKAVHVPDGDGPVKAAPVKPRFQNAGLKGIIRTVVIDGPDLNDHAVLQRRTSPAPIDLLFDPFPRLEGKDGHVGLPRVAEHPPGRIDLAFVQCLGKEAVDVGLLCTGGNIVQRNQRILVLKDPLVR